MRRPFRRVTVVTFLALVSLALAAEPDEAAAPVATTAAVEPAEPAVDRLELDTASIRGNQELPKVLSIVPWKDPALGDLVGRPVNSLVDEVLAPVDREVFQRQTDYFDQLYGDAAAGSLR